MKKYLIFIVLVLPVSFFSCNTSKSYFNKGYYDLAIQKSSKKLIKKPTKEKQINVLHKSYNIANMKDRERISFLRSSGQPEIWEEVFLLYNSLKRRQDMVKFLHPDILERMNFQPVNYDDEIHNAKRNAAEYFYATGKRFLDQNTRSTARLAYYEFLKVRKYYDNFRDTDNLMKEAEEKGTVNILFQVKNATNLIMPAGFVQELTQLSLADMNVIFRRFYNHTSNYTTYHYYISLNINDIFISPEQVKEVHYTETRQIEDGFQYVLDANGNVMKDSTGNDIKVPKLIEIKCDVVEVHLLKTVAVGATISILNEDQQPMIFEPLSGEWVFDNRFIKVEGDKRALSDETRKKLSWQPLPFPASEFMILQTTDVLKKMSKDFVYKHRNLFN
jgi:uncharacterized Zn ribbon protein